MVFRVLWAPPSWLPDLNREHGLLQPPRAPVLLPQAGRARPHAHSSAAPSSLCHNFSSLRFLGS